MFFSRTRLSFAFAVSLVAQSTLSGIAAAAPGWTPPVTLAPVSDFSLAADHDGKALILAPLNGQTESTLTAYVHPVSPSGWQPEPIDRSVCGPPSCGMFSQVQVQLDDRGEATGLWGLNYGYGNDNAITLARRPVGGGWQTLASARPLLWDFDFSLALSSNGGGLLASRCYYCDSEGHHFAAAVRSLGPDAVGLPDPLSEVGEEGGTPQAALDAAGRATVAWSSTLGVRVATRGLSGVWSLPTTVASGSGAALAVSPSGVAELVWRGDDGVVRSSRRPGPDAAWQSAVVISPGAGSSAGSPAIDVSIDSGGKAVAAWAGANGRLRAAVRPAGAPWTTQVISPAAGTLPQVAVNPAGTAFAVFSGPSGAPLESVRPQGGAWSDALPLGAAGASGVQVAADANGNAVAAWVTATGLLQSSTYDATGPVMGAPVISSAVAGQPTSAFVASWDLWSALGVVTWDFGDGAIATGASVAHSYSNPGPYTVTVRAADSFGNETARTAQVAVVDPPVHTPPAASHSTPGVAGSVGAVRVTIPGGSRAATPSPASAGTRRLKALRPMLVLPRSIKAGERTILSVRVNRPLRGALIRVQMRRGLLYRTIAQGRVSGRRVPVALTFARPGRYLLRVQISESGRPVVSRTVLVVARH